MKRHSTETVPATQRQTCFLCWKTIDVGEDHYQSRADSKFLTEHIRCADAWAKDQLYFGNYDYEDHYEGAYGAMSGHWTNPLRAQDLYH